MTNINLFTVQVLYYTVSILLTITNYSTFALIEHERMEEYRQRGHTWPPKAQDYTPNTDGWRELNEGIFRQLYHTAEESAGERYEAYMSAVNNALLSKNFTEFGWGVMRAPKPVVDKLKKRLYDGLMKGEGGAIRHEAKDVCLETNLLPYFIPDDIMNREILHDLLPLHEAWSGVELVPHFAYGLRVYRESSNLLMHVDKRTTHVISSILHVDHGANDEPWPLVIEDFHGNTNEVFLESGDMLFYESSKCRHGRPKKFKGEFYSSLFLHYTPRPSNDWNIDKQTLDIHYRIPSSDIWFKSAGRKENADVQEMSLISLCMKEPGCPHEWCRLKDSVKWHGPGPEYGIVATGNGKVTDLRGKIPSEESFGKIEDEL